MLEMTTSQLAQLAADQGLELFSVLSGEEAGKALASSQPRLASWQAEGHAGEMDYMKRPPSLFTDLDHFLPECRSVVSFVVSYLQPNPIAQESEEDQFRVSRAPHGYGRVARYAWGRDYHRVLNTRLKHLVESARIFLQDQGELKSRIFSDAVPILERTLAASASLGFVGKNTMLIRPGIGSFSFLAEILWNVEVVHEDIVSLPATSAPGNQSAGSGCGGCSRCLNACPTGAFPEPGVLDAPRCISYLTIEKGGELNEWERSAIDDWLFGCDICQEVCPFNHRGLQSTKINEFLARPGNGPYISLLELLRIRSKEEFTAKFAGTPIMRAGWEQMLRNACAVVGNSGFVEARPELEWLYKNSESKLLVQASSMTLGLL